MGAPEQSSFSELPRVEFAPLNVPLKRRRQTFAALVYSTLIWQALGLVLIFCLFPPSWPILLLYIAFISYDNSAEEGGRRVQWVRGLFLWKWLADFFPARLLSEGSLDPTKTYIFGYHPHGILGTGAFLNFGTEATGFSQLFPGLNIRLLTLTTNFYIPFYRELLLSLGCASVSKKSIFNIVNQGGGNGCLIVVGGAQESLSAKPDRVDLVLAKRYGFVAIAIKTGSSLVPVFGFGENSLYDQVVPKAGSKLQSFQDGMKRKVGFTLPIFFGRGIFNYTYGIIPRRRPLNVVVGKPIHLEKDENPSSEKIQKVHQEYMEALKDLYDRNKDKYHVGENCPPDMRFI